MFRGYRHYIIAAFGCLAFAGTSSWSQPPGTERISSPPPAPKEQASGATNNAKPSPQPLAVTIIETPEQRVTADRAQAESRQHDARDLDAQIKAANAAEKQVFPSWMGGILSFIGTVLLIWTLLETRKSANAARDAADYAREALWSNRAWVCSAGVDHGKVAEFIETGEKDCYAIVVKWKNCGITPALNVDAFRDFKIFPADGALPTFPVRESTEQNTTVGPGDTFAVNTVFLGTQDTADFRDRKVKIAIYSIIRYRDVFSKVVRKSECCIIAEHNGGKMVQANGMTVENVGFAPSGPQNSIN